MTVRVRFAPSPTGNLHIGSVRTALFNWLYAKNQKGEIVLRIEDTDKERSTKEFEQDILDGLTWLGLTWDNDLNSGQTFYQSKRTDIYKKYVDQLLEQGKAYKDKESPAIYFRVPSGGQTTLLDAIKGPITFENKDIKDQVLLKSDGQVTYNFAVVIDDAQMGITHIIRGEDHISNSPKQILMYEALGFKLPTFAHLPLILATDRSKLSKRRGNIATSVNDYRKQGFLPEAIVNYLALLGWTPEDGTEIMGTEELIKKFSLERVSKSNSIFDITKLKWMNAERIKLIKTPELAKICLEYLSSEKKGQAPDKQWFEQVVELIRDGMSVFSDINELTELFFEDKVVYSDKGKTILGLPAEAQSAKAGTEEARKVLKYFQQQLTIHDSPFTSASADQMINSTIKDLGLGKGKVLKPLRVALTGRESGPALKDTLCLLGKEKCLQRLSSLLSAKAKEAKAD